MDRAHPPVAPEVLAKLRLVCLDLPEVVEEPAWTGIRWTVRKKNFAQVLMLDAGWPPHEVAALLAGSYRVLAPKKLAARVEPIGD